MPLDIDTGALDGYLTEQRVRGFQMIYVALAGAIMVFLVMLLFFFGLGSDMDRSEASPAAMNALSVMVAAVTLLCLVAGQTVYVLIFRRGRSARVGDADVDPVESAIRRAQRATITRAVIFDGPAFFGVVACMVGMLQGVVFVRPIYLLNALPAFAQLAFLAVTFPTRDKIVRLLRGRFQG
jgi:hypothetical protein